MQPPKTEAGNPVQKSSAKRIPGGTVSVGITNHAQGDHSERMPWWNWPLKPPMNAQPDAWPFLLASNACTGKDTCQEIPAVHHLQGEATEGPHGKYCSHPSPGASAYQLPTPGTREAKVREGPDSNMPLHEYMQADVTQSQWSWSYGTILLSIMGCQRKSF